MFFRGHVELQVRRNAFSDRVVQRHLSTPVLDRCERIEHSLDELLAKVHQKMKPLRTEGIDNDGQVGRCDAHGIREFFVV